MPRPFLFHVLGVWLLLSQIPRAISAGWMDEVIKLCGRELARAEIDICGNMYYYRERTGVRQKETPRQSGPPAGESARPPSPEKEQNARIANSLNREELGALPTGHPGRRGGQNGEAGEPGRIKLPTDPQEAGAFPDPRGKLRARELAGWGWAPGPASQTDRKGAVSRWAAHQRFCDPEQITPSSIYEDSTSPSEYLGFGTHSRRKRQIHRSLNQQCCNFGCTRKHIARAC
ncbi:prorelaxin-like [Cynocephalus volans]|uniref:prorelaxin-like n=1 Tax=Cynocephalus volans TaxID=110931 RepID=UPI002FCA8C60